jgi:polysaccharide pyruvyl transferase CsaB
VNFLLSGYYGYHNAGDEAVLAAMLEHLRAAAPSGTRFTITSGDPAATVALHGDGQLAAIARQNPRALLAAIRACDVFISGGGSLLQDVTSLRNVAYYTGLLRLAQLARKPTMFYAQGVGPLRHPISRRLARAAVAHARVITVRDNASRDLLQKIGVGRPIEITADPVWGLEAGGWRLEAGGKHPRSAAARAEAVENRSPFPASSLQPPASIWLLALRSWPGAEEAQTRAQSTRLVAAARAAAREANATLRFLPLQPERDRPWMEAGGARAEEIVDVAGWHPRRFVEEAARCDLMIGIRLHALIFAASQSTPCVAINYDPKVEALAHQIGAPLLHDLSDAELSKLPQAIAAARPLSREKLDELQAKARRNAELAAGLLP